MNFSRILTNSVIRIRSPNSLFRFGTVSVSERLPKTTFSWNLPVSRNSPSFVEGVVARNFATKAQRQDLTKVMDEGGVIPDVIDTVPKETVGVKYGSLEVKQGNVLTPTQVKDPPAVTWTADANKFYVLCMTDPDAPSRKDPKFREWHHWLVGNIPGNNVAKGDILSAYVGSGPPQGTGLHRYVFLVYEQPGKLKFPEPRLTNRSGDNRGGFSIRKFAAKHKLGEPIAGNFYQAEWDSYVPKLYEQLAGK